MSTWCLIFRVWNSEYIFQLTSCHRLCLVPMFVHLIFFSRTSNVYTILEWNALLLKRDCFLDTAVLIVSNTFIFVLLIWRLIFVCSLVFRVFSSMTFHYQRVLSFNWRIVSCFHRVIRLSFVMFLPSSVRYTIPYPTVFDFNICAISV